MLRTDQELVRLTEAIGWAGLAESFGALYPEKTGRPGVMIRTMAGLVMLQHTFGLSDELVVAEWPGNPGCGKKVRIDSLTTANRFVHCGSSHPPPREIP